MRRFSVGVVARICHRFHCRTTFRDGQSGLHASNRARKDEGPQPRAIAAAGPFSLELLPAPLPRLLTSNDHVRVPAEHDVDVALRGQGLAVPVCRPNSERNAWRSMTSVSVFAGSIAMADTI